MERTMNILKPNGIVAEIKFNEFKSTTAFVYLIGQEDPIIINTSNVAETLLEQYKEYVKGNDKNKYFGYRICLYDINDVTNTFHEDAYKNSIKNGRFDVNTFLKEKGEWSVEWEEKHINLEHITHIEVKISSTCEKGRASM